MMGALNLSPLETKIMRNVPSVTSTILPKNIIKGSKYGDASKKSNIIVKAINWLVFEDN